MKNLTFLLVTFVVLFLALPSGAQTFHLGVIGGWNSASFTLKANQGEKQEVNARNMFGAGGVLGIGINQFVFVELQPMYLQKGGTYVQNAPSPDFELKATYFEIPLFLKVAAFRDGFQPYVMGGPSFGFLLTSDLEGEVGGLKFNADFKDVTKNFELGLGFGAGIRFPLGIATLFMEGRYVFGLGNINKGGTIQFKYGDMVIEEDEIAKEDEVSNKGLRIMAGVTFSLGGL
jgi:hypothetical protein